MCKRVWPYTSTTTYLFTHQWTESTEKSLVSMTSAMWIMRLSGVMMTMMLRNDVGEHKLYFFSDTNYISIDKYNLIFFILILRMSWLLGGVAYDVAKWTVKKGVEGWKEA